MSFRTSIAVLGLVATFAAAPVAAEDLVLEPASEWKLREYDDKCRMSRIFGTGEDSVTLWLDQGGEQPTYNLTLIGRPMRNPYGTNISIQFAPEPEYSRAYLQAKSSKGRPVISLFGTRLTPTKAERELLGLDEASERSDEPVPLEAPRSMSDDRIAAITELRLGRALMKPMVLRTGALAEPLSRLQTCAEKVTELVARNTALAAIPPQPTEIERWAGIIQQNYPKHLIRAGEEARVAVRLTISKQGKPSYCEITNVRGLTSFNDTVCLLLLRHATFKPARSADGTAIAARYATRVTFRLN